MPTSRPFSYNTGALIPGTTQSGNIAVGYPTAGFTATGLNWWNGPDEDLGYVIAIDRPLNNQPTPDGKSASVGFWRSSALTDNSFISLAQSISKTQSFATTNDAKTWVNNSGYWTSYTSNPLWDTLTNYYTLDNTTNDVKGTSNGTLINGLGYTTGKINNGLNFNGTNNSLSFPDNFFKPSGDFSISFWFNVASITGISTFLLDIGGGQQGYADGLAIYVPNGTGGDLRLYIDASNILSFGTVSINTWHHVVLTHKTSTNYKAYLNGSLIGTKVTTKQITFPATTYGAFGSSKTGASSYSNFSALKGDEISFFDSELTSTNVTELYNSGSGKQYPL